MLQHPVLKLLLGGHHAGHRLDNQVVPGTVGVRPLASERGVLAVDDARVQPGQGVVVHAQLGSHVGPVVDQGHVHLRDVAAQNVLRFGGGEVQGEAALTPVVGQEGTALRGGEGLRVTPGVAPRRFNLDDLGPHVGQQHTGQRTGDNLGKLDYLYALKRAGHDVPP